MKPLGSIKNEGGLVMKVKTNVSTILVSEENRYVSLGLNIPDIEEIQIF